LLAVILEILMPDEISPQSSDFIPELQPKNTSAFARIWKYIAVRLATLAIMVFVGIFISIVVINYGGQLDKIYEAAIIEAVPKMAVNYPNLTSEEKAKVLDQIHWDMEESLGLHSSFIGRCLRWTAEAMVFNTQDPSGTGRWDGQDQQFLQDVLSRFPKTLLLVGTTNMLVFIASLFLGLYLSKQQGKFLDRLMSGLVPLSSIPNWAFAILLTAIFAWQLNILPAQGMYDMFPPKFPIGYIWIVFKHMILPMAALFLSIFFQLVYSWRSLFLLTAGEDYVELARAKGLPERMIRSRYLIRPTMPYIITSFALIFLSMWQGIIILERFFNWQGIGQYFQMALSAGNSSPLAKLQMTTLIVIFIYLLAITMLFLDIIYVLVDPRIKIGGQEKTLRTVSREKLNLKNLFERKEKPAPNKFTSIQALPGEKPPLSDKVKKVVHQIQQAWLGFKGTSSQVMKKPSAITGVVILIILLMLMGYALIFIPKSTAVSLWSPVNPEVFLNPRLVPPVWTNLFRKSPLPITIIMDSNDQNVEKQILSDPDVVSLDRYTFRFDYSNANFPQDLFLRFNAQFQILASLVTLTWITPDGRTYDLGKLIANNDKLFIVSQDLSVKLTHLYNLDTRINALGKEAFTPVDALFASSNTQKVETARGTYQLIVNVQNFEPDASVHVTMVLYGKVYGLAGTDSNRRDILVPLLWGIPVALVFGVIGATLTVLFSLLIAALGTWKGGWIDGLIQRISEINLVIPAIPLAIMFFFLFNKSIWAVLAVFVIFNVFGSSLKTFRAALLQVKDAPYIEAAQAYGAGDWRIIWNYLVPYLLPMVIPQWITMIPAYVFLEASLSFFGVFDPVLPTWGKLIYDAFTGGALGGNYYWILEPVGMIVLLGLAFSLLGHAMDDVLNPRLRTS
jgi:peptide/nickel transport system permease protein